MLHGHITLPAEESFRLKLLEILSISTRLELSARRIGLQCVETTELSTKLQEQSLREDMDMDGVDYKSVENEGNYLSRARDMIRHDQNDVFTHLSWTQGPNNYIEVDPSTLSWISVHDHGRALIHWLEMVRRRYITPLGAENKMLLLRKEERDRRLADARAAVHPILNNLDDLADRLQDLSHSLQRNRSLLNNTSSTPAPLVSENGRFEPSQFSVQENESNFVQGDSLLRDDQVHRRFQKLLTDAEALCSNHIAHDNRLAFLELEFGLLDRRSPQPTRPSRLEPFSPAIDDLEPSIMRFIEQQFQNILNTPGSDLCFSPKDLLDLKTVYNDCSDWLASPNQLMWKMQTILSLPEAEVEDGEILQLALYSAYL